MQSPSERPRAREAAWMSAAATATAQSHGTISMPRLATALAAQAVDLVRPNTSMHSAAFTAFITADETTASTISAPGSRCARAMTAEASSTTASLRATSDPRQRSRIYRIESGGFLPAHREQLVDEGDAGGNLRCDSLLKRTDGHRLRPQVDSAVVHVEKQRIPWAHAELPTHLCRQKHAPIRFQFDTHRNHGLLASGRRVKI
jgi:hypothetical protein